MKKLTLLSMLVILITILDSCKKEEEKDFNTLKITSGEFSGFELTFDPNLGFWSPVTETTRQVHLVLGDDENIISEYENVMSILFYDDGSPQVTFPSPEGQWIEFGLNIDGTVYYFHEIDAVLTINKLDDFNFEGSLSGEFADHIDGTRVTTLTLDIRLALEEI